jgi:hypothetical protein
MDFERAYAARLALNRSKNGGRADPPRPRKAPGSGNIGEYRLLL